MADQSIPIKGVAFDLGFTLLKNDGTVIANPGTYTKKIWKDGGGAADIAGSVTETDTTYGVCVVQLSATEMNADRVQVFIKDDTPGCVPFPVTIYPAGGNAYAEALANNAILASGTYGNAAMKTLLDAIAGYIDTEVAAILADTNELQTDLANGGRLDLLVDGIKAKTDNLPAAPAAVSDLPSAATVTTAVWGAATKALTDKAGFSLAADQSGVTIGTVNALAAGAVASIWSALLTGITTAGSVGKLIKDYLNAAVDSRMASFTYAAPPAAADIADAVWDASMAPYAGGGSNAGGTLVEADSGATTAAGYGNNIDAAVSALGTPMQAGSYVAPPAAADVADAVWDEAASGHVATGSTGKKLADASSGGTPLDAAGVRSAVGLGSANLDMQLAGLPTDADVNAACDTAISDAGLAKATDLGTVDTVVDAIKLKTDNLPSDPASDTTLEGMTDMWGDVMLAVAAASNALSGYNAMTPLKDEIDIIKGHTDFITAAPAVPGNAMALTSAYDRAKDDVLTTLGAVKAKTDNLPASPAATGAKMDLVDAPNATALGAIASAISGLATTGLAALKTLLDTTGIKVATNADKTGYSGTATNMVAAAPTPDAVADAVWDEALADHAGAGTMGARLGAAASAGDPWLAEIPGDYAEGTAGALLPDLSGALGRLGSGVVNVVSPVRSDGTWGPLVAGDDYVAGTDTELFVVVSGIDLDGATVVCNIGEAVIGIACTVSAAGDDLKVTLDDLTAAQTAGLEKRVYKREFEARWTSPARKLTFGRANIKVLEDAP